MCKYCKMIPTDVGGEMDGLSRIGSIKNGHEVAELYLRRYYDGDSYRINALHIDLGVTVNNGRTIYCEKEKNIAIKYCPFCGEKF